MKTKKGYRPSPPAGTVVAVPLKGGGFGHIVNIDDYHWWIYRFITDAPCADKSLFPSKDWMKYFSGQEDGIGSGTFDELSLALSLSELAMPAYYTVQPQWALDMGRIPTRYRVSDPSKPPKDQDYYVEESQLHLFQLHTMFTAKQLEEYIESRRPEMEFITLREDQKLKGFSVGPQEEPEPESTFEIWMSGLDAMELDDVNEIADELDEELSKHDAGEVIGTGGVEGQDQQNIAVRCEGGSAKLALACIRRVLKRLKGNPETTDIWENQEGWTDHVSHSLSK